MEGQVVTGNFFDVLGIRPVIGRTFTRMRTASARWSASRFSPTACGSSVSAATRALSAAQSPERKRLHVMVWRPGGSPAPLGGTPELWVPMAMQEEVRPPSAGALRQRLGSTRMLGVRDVRWLRWSAACATGLGRRHRGSARHRSVAGWQAAYPESNRDLSATAMRLGRRTGLRRDARPCCGCLPRR